jgi:hypothetical protein
MRDGNDDGHASMRCDVLDDVVRRTMRMIASGTTLLPPTSALLAASLRFVDGWHRVAVMT